MHSAAATVNAVLVVFGRGGQDDHSQAAQSGTKIRKEKEEGLKRDLAQDADVEFLANGEE